MTLAVKFLRRLLALLLIASVTSEAVGPGIHPSGPTVSPAIPAQTLALPLEMVGSYVGRLSQGLAIPELVIQFELLVPRYAKNSHRLPGKPSRISATVRTHLPTTPQVPHFIFRPWKTALVTALLAVATLGGFWVFKSSSKTPLQPSWETVFDGSGISYNYQRSEVLKRLPATVSSFITDRPSEGRNRTDVIGLFEPHAYSSELTLTLEAITAAARFQGRSVVLIWENTALPDEDFSAALEDPTRRAVTEERIFEGQLAARLKGRVEELRKEFASWEKARRLVDPSLTMDPEHRQYVQSVQGFVDRHPEVTLRLENCPEAIYQLPYAYLYKVRAAERPSLREDPTKDWQEHLKHSTAWVQMRNQWVIDQVDGLSRMPKPSVVVLIFGPLHSTVMDGMDPRRVRMMKVLFGALSPNTLRPEDWALYRRLFRGEAPLTVNELDFLKQSRAISEEIQLERAKGHIDDLLSLGEATRWAIINWTHGVLLERLSREAPASPAGIYRALPPSKSQPRAAGKTSRRTLRAST